LTDVGLSLKGGYHVTKDTSTISAPFLKELDLEFQRFLELVDSLESERVGKRVAMVARKAIYCHRKTLKPRSSL
jgi:hypothetical protein